MGAAVRSSHDVSAASSLGGMAPHTIPLLQHRVPPMETVLHELLQCASFPSAEVLNELLLHGFLP